MAKDPDYRQFILEHKNSTGTTTLTTWLPERKGKDTLEVGTHLTIENRRGDSKELEGLVWTVKSVGTTARSAKSVIDRSYVHTKYRSNTDV